MGIFFLALVVGVSGAQINPQRSGKFFDVDITKHKITGIGARTQHAFTSRLVSVSTDQPQYWPNEKVFLKVIALGRGGEQVKGSWSRRDAGAHPFTLALDQDGVGVLTLMDGGATKLELGEYRADLGELGSATFAVVEGSLGALSFAYEFKRVTSTDALDQAKGGWFLGNAAGAGKRWGNGLSFKNELRVANQPYDGEVTIYSRCMLPGCNGAHAGRDMTMKVVHGAMQGTLEVGGHSGPFQIEVITPRGSLRYQFEGSSHVERDMVVVSGGVGAQFRAGLAPYENTEAVPGKQIFVEKTQGANGDAFSLASVVAQHGTSTLHTTTAVKSAQLLVFTPSAKGAYTVEKRELGDLAAGKDIVVKVSTPYTIIAVGGFAGARFVEGWAMVFAPAGLRVALAAPEKAAPKAHITVDIKVTDDNGAPLAVSGIVEAFDNRVASRSAEQGLSSAVGDSLRNSAQTLNGWEDTTGIDDRTPPSNRNEEREKAYDGPPPPPSPMPMMQAAPAKLSAKRSMGASATASIAVSGESGAAEEDDAPKEMIREGERKVVLVQALRTGADGHAKIELMLPPQTGRVTLRFVAAHGLDFAAAQRDVDASLAAYVDAQAPHVIVPGAAISVRVDAGNATSEPLRFTASGAAKKSQEIPVGGAHVMLDLTHSGALTLRLANQAGHTLDERVLPIDSVGTQRVTYSRLELGGPQAIAIGKDETAVVYRGSGELLHGIVMNMVTTMESWFGHAEAVSARMAADAVLIAAFDQKILDDDGLGNTVRTGFDKSVRDLDEVFVDHQRHLVRPYPGLEPSLRFTAWVARNLETAVHALDATKSKDARVAQALALARTLKTELDGALAREKLPDLEKGQWTIPVEIDGKVVYRMPTDDAVSRWAVGTLIPELDRESSDGLEVSKLYDVFRFLRAFERVGVLQYLTDVAEGLWRKGDRVHFAALYRRIARGIIFAQEPGMIQGPALLGGVYSTPMAMVRFLELQLLMNTGAPAGTPTRSSHAVVFGARVPGPGSLVAPAGTVVRVDRPGTLTLAPTDRASGSATVSTTHTHIGGELTLEVALDAAHDPLEYYALIAVPSTTAIKQTEDILADYGGTLLYGQQAMGATKMQVVSVPFRGSRTLRLWLEGAYTGTSPGLIMIRHIENPGDVSGVAIPPVQVE